MYAKSSKFPFAVKYAHCNINPHGRYNAYSDFILKFNFMIWMFSKCFSFN